MQNNIIKLFYTIILYNIYELQNNAIIIIFLLLLLLLLLIVHINTRPGTLMWSCSSSEGLQGAVDWMQFSPPPEIQTRSVWVDLHHRPSLQEESGLIRAAEGEESGWTRELQPGPAPSLHTEPRVTFLLELDWALLGGARFRFCQFEWFWTKQWSVWVFLE